jgi:hypothetical protein
VRAKEGCGGSGGKKGADGHESDAKTFKNNALCVCASVVLYIGKQNFARSFISPFLHARAAQTHDGVYVGWNSLCQHRTRVNQRDTVIRGSVGALSTRSPREIALGIILVCL